MEKIDKTIKIPPAPSRMPVPKNANMAKMAGKPVTAAKSAVKKTTPRSK